MKRFDVVGSVLGDDDVDGDEEVGEDEVGAAPSAIVHRGHRYHRENRRMRPMPPKPGWRGGELAPGVQHPDEGMVPLPMQPTNGWNGTFTSAVTTGLLQGQLQKPYRAERLLAFVGRSGTSATTAIRVLGQFFIGVDLNQAQLQGIDLELVGAPTSFGTRLTLHQAPPGVVISIPCQLFGGALAATTTDYMTLTAMFLGRIIH